MKTDKAKTIRYPVWTVRLSKETISWLKLEKNNFTSWNKFFEKLRENYDQS